MSLEDNKSLVRRFYKEVWNKGNGDVALEVFAESYVRHDLRPGTPTAGPEGQKQIAEDFRKAFPDLEFTIDLMLAEEDLVATRWTMRGTNAGRWGSVPPTGKRAEFSGVNIFRFANGKVVEIWNHRDDLGLREQLGTPVYAGSNRGTEQQAA